MSQASDPGPPRPAGSSDDPIYTFAWHPVYAGQSVNSVRAELSKTLASDQRAYALALEAAEQHENDSLQTVIELERRWGPFDLNWAEADPNQLANRVVHVEWERERQREMLPVSVLRTAADPTDDDESDQRDPVSRERLTSNSARGIVVLVVLLIAVLLWWFVLRG